MDFTRRYPSFCRVLIHCAIGIGCTSSALSGEIQGFTEPYQDVDVAVSEMGIVEAIHVKEGDRVTEGQVVVQMDASLLELSQQIAKGVKESRGQLESAMEELELSAAMLAKLETLYSRHHASRQEVERAETQRRIAEARLMSVREELQIKALEYQRVSLQLEKRKLKSPIAGIVTRIYKDRGESVLLNDPVLVKVVQLNPLLAVFLVPSDDAQLLKRVTTVEVRIDATSERTQGVVEFVSPTTDPQSSLARVRVRIPNPEERLPCGAACYLEFDGEASSTLANAAP